MINILTILVTRIPMIFMIVVCFAFSPGFQGFGSGLAGLGLRMYRAPGPQGPKH